MGNEGIQGILVAICESGNERVIRVLGYSRDQVLGAYGGGGHRQTLGIGEEQGFKVW
jgi:hypothetical protein